METIRSKNLFRALISLFIAGSCVGTAAPMMRGFGAYARRYALRLKNYGQRALRAARTVVPKKLVRTPTLKMPARVSSWAQKIKSAIKWPKNNQQKSQQLADILRGKLDSPSAAGMQTHLNALRQSVSPQVYNKITSNVFSRQGSRRSIYSLREFKGIYDIFPKGYEKFSPAYGAAFFESDYFKKMYKYGNPEHATIKLIHQLFHVTGESDCFRATQLPGNAGWSLTPELIGHLLGALETGKLRDSQEMIEVWQEAHKHAIEQAQIKNCSATLKKKKINRLAKLIEQSLQECRDGMYLPETTYNILLALLYARGEDKHDVLAYIAALQNYLDLNINAEAKQQFLGSAAYTAKDAEAYRKAVEELDAEATAAVFCASQTFEQTVFEAIKHKKDVGVFPPKLILNTQCGYRGQQPFPPCREDALREVCNILLYNQETGEFDFNLLPTTIQPHDDFVEFYEQHPDVRTRATSQAWINLVSGKNHLDIKYLRGDYEIGAPTTNILKLLNYFFNTNAESFEELGQLLSTEARVVDLEPQHEVHEADRSNVINFRISDNAMGVKRFALNLRSNHGFVVRSEHDEKPFCGMTANEVLPSLSNKTKRDRAAAMSSLLGTVVSDVRFSGGQLNRLHHILFSSDLDNANLRLITIKRLLAERGDDDCTKEFVAGLISSLPDDDPYYYTNVIEAFKENAVDLRDRAYKVFWDKLKSIADVLPWVAAKGYLDIVKFLLKEGVDINSTETNLNTALMWATRWGDWRTFRFLIKAGADVRRANTSGVTALMFAAERYGARVLCLLEAGADVNAADCNGDTALIYATRSRDYASDVLSIVRSLVRAGADVNLANRSGSTALIEARDHEVTRFLLEAGADVNHVNKKGSTPLIKAALYDSVDKVRCLIKAGANINQVDKRGETPLLKAVRSGSVKKMRCLVEAGADIDAEDDYGVTLLGMAASGNFNQGTPRVGVRPLIEAGADVNKVSGRCGHTPLIAAVMRGSLNEVRNLIKAGADVNRADREGNTALSIASACGYRDIVRCLIRAGAEVTTSKFEDRLLGFLHKLRVKFFGTKK